MLGFSACCRCGPVYSLQSRRHWLSARVYKRQLLLGYMVFNAALYGGQLLLYSLLFLPSFDKVSAMECRRTRYDLLPAAGDSCVGNADVGCQLASQTSDQEAQERISTSHNGLSYLLSVV